jgi:hypothetical protein
VRGGAQIIPQVGAGYSFVCQPSHKAGVRELNSYRWLFNWFDRRINFKNYFNILTHVSISEVVSICMSSQKFRTGSNIYR